MACKASKVPLLQAIAKRGYAAHACPRPVGDVSDVNVKVLDNKLVVATAKACVPISRVSLIVRAGSRFESYDNRGASHWLRIASSLGTQNSTGFAITRNIQQVGGSLTSSGDREVVAYTLQTSADNLETGLRYMQDLVQPAFKPWELSDNEKTLKIQLAGISPQDLAVELCHRSAFRTGLGNSVWIPKYQIGKLGTEDLLQFVCSTFSPSRAAIVGVGVDANALAGFAQSLDFIGNGDVKTDSPNYYGGDTRKDTAGHQAHVAIAGLGGASSNNKEALAFAILEQAIGGAPVTKRGNSGGLLSQAVACSGAEGPVSVKAINASYSDAGLFGFVVSADTKNISKVIDFLTRGLKSASVSAEDVNRGKALLKGRVLQTFSSDSGLIEELGRQAILTRTVADAETLVSAIDGITQEQVQQAAKKVASSKLSIGAVGNLANVPYASELA